MPGLCAAGPRGSACAHHVAPIQPSPGLPGRVATHRSSQTAWDGVLPLSIAEVSPGLWAPTHLICTGPGVWRTARLGLPLLKHPAVSL